MAIQNAEELFIALLSDLRDSESRLVRLTDDLSQKAQDPELKNTLSVRSYLTQQAVNNIDKCFQLLGKQPVQSTSRFKEVWADDTERELNAIQGPIARNLYALMKIRTIQNFHLGEYAALVAMAMYAGNIGVTALLEHNLADKVEFVERTREFFREMARQALLGRAAGKAA
jgi:ferritin-like metal-binding protein YciE